MKSEHQNKNQINDTVNKKRWDVVYREKKDFFEVDKNIPKIATLFHKKGVNRILDLGSGSGRHVVYLVENSFEVYGIDISPEGIKETKRKLKLRGLKADLALGSIYKRLPYDNSFFDAVVSIRVINHARIKDIRVAIKEIERVLRPKGLLFITTRKRVSKKKRLPHKNIAPRTYIPLEGKEKGIVHYLFTKEILRKEFRNFQIHSLLVKNNYYCLFGELKKQ